MSSYYLGIGIGATKSHALLVDAGGNAVGFGNAGPGNHEVIGWEGYRSVVKSITRQAIPSAKIDIQRIKGAGFGVAGYDWPAQRLPIVEGIQALRLDCPFEVVNDAVLGIFARSTDGWGISIISGTGENCWGVNQERQYGHMTGNSALLGEFGGAGTIVHRGLREVAKEWGQRGPKTKLTQAFIERTGAADLDDLLEGFVMGRYDLNAGDAPLVFKVANASNSVAAEVIRWAGTELAGMVNGVSRQLNFTDQAFEVILIGSTFNGGALLLDPLKDSVLKVNPAARFLRLDAPPVVGGVRLGMEQVGVNGFALRKNLIESTQKIIHQSVE